MMTQTKTYIELSDLKALRFECKGCRAVLLLPFTADLSTGIKACPKCRKGWTALENFSYATEIEAFIRATNDLLPHLKAMGFSLTLEVTPQG
jgi:hypothetical protein